MGFFFKRLVKLHLGGRHELMTEIKLRAASVPSFDAFGGNHAARTIISHRSRQPATLSSFTTSVISSLPAGVVSTCEIFGKIAFAGRSYARKMVGVNSFLRAQAASRNYRKSPENQRAERTMTCGGWHALIEFERGHHVGKVFPFKNKKKKTTGKQPKSGET